MHLRKMYNNRVSRTNNYNKESVLLCVVYFIVQLLICTLPPTVLTSRLGDIIDGERVA